MSVLKLFLSVDHQQKLGELVLSVSSCHSHYFRRCFKLEHIKYGYGNFGHRYNVSPFTCMHFWVWGIVVRWSVTAESWRNTVLGEAWPSVSFQQLPQQILTDRRLTSLAWWVNCCRQYHSWRCAEIPERQRVSQITLCYCFSNTFKWNRSEKKLKSDLYVHGVTLSVSGNNC
jgi:hypothetical protein